MIADPIAEIIRAKVFLAPMAGVTDIPFRLIAQEYGCRFSFTEMIDVNGIAYNNKKTVRMLDKIPGLYTPAVQIVGIDEINIIKAALFCQEQGYRLLEFNAACPVKKIIKQGKGAALLKDLPRLKNIISNLVKELSVPVTVKIRSGWDENNINCLDTVRVVARAGARAVCIHPRTRSQMYRGKADHRLTAAVKAAVSIPVFASGDIYNPSDVNRVRQETKCDAVAVARGALGRPWLFSQIYQSLSGRKTAFAPSWDKIKTIIEHHLLLSVKFYGEKRGLLRMQKSILWYLKKYKNKQLIMDKYRKLTRPENIHSFLANISLLNNKNLSITESRPG